MSELLDQLLTPHQRADAQHAERVRNTVTTEERLAFESPAFYALVQENAALKRELALAREALRIKDPGTVTVNFRGIDISVVKTYEPPEYEDGYLRLAEEWGYESAYIGGVDVTALLEEHGDAICELIKKECSRDDY